MHVRPAGVPTGWRCWRGRSESGRATHDGQLILEQAALTEVDRRVVDQVFDVPAAT